MSRAPSRPAGRIVVVSNRVPAPSAAGVPIHTPVARQLRLLGVLHQPQRIRQAPNLMCTRLNQSFGITPKVTLLQVPQSHSLRNSTCL